MRRPFSRNHLAKRLLPRGVDTLPPTPVGSDVLGFQTAAGRMLPITQEKLNDAASFSRNHLAKRLLPRGVDTLPPTPVGSDVLGFQTAAGRMLRIAQEKLNDAASLLAEPPSKTAVAEGRGYAPPYSGGVRCAWFPNCGRSNASNCTRKTK